MFYWCVRAQVGALTMACLHSGTSSLMHCWLDLWLCSLPLLSPMSHRGPSFRLWFRGKPLTWPGFSQPQSERKALLNRRITLGGVLIFVLMLALFPNVTVLPSQVVRCQTYERPVQLVNESLWKRRHLNKSDSTITPNDPLVQQLKDEVHFTHLALLCCAVPLTSPQFFTKVPKAKYDTMPFATQMYTVDKFIFERVRWLCISTLRPPAR